MKVIRSMVLVSVDDTSLARGAQDVFRAFLDEIDEFGLSNQVAVTTIRDAGIHGGHAARDRLSGRGRVRTRHGGGRAYHRRGAPLQGQHCSFAAGDDA